MDKLNSAGEMTAMAENNLQLAVVLPTYNEHKNIATMVERLDKALTGIAWEVVIVDDNSPDGTSDEARRLSLTNPRVRCIERIGRRGLASAAIEGMCSTAAPVVAVMDADHQHDPILLPQMLEAVNSGDYDLAYASRFAEGASTEEWGGGQTGSRPQALPTSSPTR